MDVERGRGLGGFEGKRTGSSMSPAHLAAEEIAKKLVASAPTCGRHSFSWRPSRGALDARWT